MNRLTIPSLEQSPAASQPLLDAVNKQLGVVPNLFRLVGNSPAALEGYLGLGKALGKGSIGAATGERIALAIAEVNQCGYCLSAHSYLGKNLVKLDDAEIAANRAGGSGNARADAAVRFAVQVARARGHVADAEVQAVKAAGFSEAEIIEIVLHVALNTWTNYINEVARTTIDFPVAQPLRSA